VILSTHTTSTKLTRRVEEVQVVGATVRLSHADDGSVERHVTVMVSRVLSNVSSELSHLDLGLEFLLEAGVEHLALGRFESIHDVRNRTHIVVLREENELSVDELRVIDSVPLSSTIV
jgi:hypothetical protein